MNPQIQETLNAFSSLLSKRSTVLTEVDSKHALDLNGVKDKITASIISTFDERCSRTGTRIASWIFHREQNKFVLNRLYKSGKQRFNQ